ncbi:MAG: histidine kinase [Tolypothrix carrinoi HA7290-LM1]|nr:histidine kinase [Tolypothrix carrinoi HA7290-LM1]
MGNGHARNGNKKKRSRISMPDAPCPMPYAPCPMPHAPFPKL